MSTILILAAGLVAGYVYARALAAAKDRAERVRPAALPTRTILADCSTCGRTLQTRNGRCSRCGSSAIVTLGVAVPEPTSAQVGATLARVAFLADVTARAVARNEQARGASRGVH